MSKTSDKVKKFRKKIKKRSLIYKGSKCIVCGYSRCSSSLHFHHLDERNKNFAISEKGHTRSWSKVKPELDKCVLLCANCHGELHSNLFKIEDFLENNPSPKEGNEMLRKHLSSDRELQRIKIKENFCEDCKIPISKSGKKCVKCSSSSRNKILWPSTRSLKEDLKSKSFKQLARELGVSDNAIRKRIKNHPNA